MRSPCFIILILICFNSLNAQSTLGFKIGGLSSSLRINKELRKESNGGSQRLFGLLSYEVGFSFNHKISPAFDIDTDLTFAKKGYGFYSFFNGKKELGKMILSSFNLPILLNFRPKQDKLAFVLGLQTNYLLKREFMLNGIPASSNNFWKSFDMSLNIGFAFNLREDLKFMFAYQFGLPTVNKFDSITIYETMVDGLKFRSRAVQLAVYHYLLTY